MFYSVIVTHVTMSPPINNVHQIGRNLHIVGGTATTALTTL